MHSSDLLGVLFALISSVVWGSGDFSGGFATRRRTQFQVVALSALTGLIILAAIAAIVRESLPSLSSSLWAAAAGISGTLGIAALYQALSLGYTALVAPTAAVIGASLPVLFALFTQASPRIEQQIGFLAAIFGIWLVTQSPARSREVSRHGFGLALLAGTGFAGFFILIAQVQRGRVILPLMIARGASLLVALFFILLKGGRLPALSGSSIALLAGVLDTGGNVFYMLANQFTRLDIAAVLASLYPAITVILARFLLKENVSRTQWFGIAFCLIAVTLIAL